MKEGECEIFFQICMSKQHIKTCVFNHNRIGRLIVGVTEKYYMSIQAHYLYSNQQDLEKRHSPPLIDTCITCIIFYYWYSKGFKNPFNQRAGPSFIGFNLLLVIAEHNARIVFLV